MRFGLMVGPERGRYATKVARMVADVQWAEQAGFDTVWLPEIPDDFEEITACAMVGAQSTRIEIGTAVIPARAPHPVVLAKQALSVPSVCGVRLSLGRGVSPHWIIDGM